MYRIYFTSLKIKDAKIPTSQNVEDEPNAIAHCWFLLNIFPGGDLIKSWVFVSSGTFNKHWALEDLLTEAVNR